MNFDSWSFFLTGSSHIHKVFCSKDAHKNYIFKYFLWLFQCLQCAQVFKCNVTFSQTRLFFFSCLSDFLVCWHFWQFVYWCWLTTVPTSLARLALNKQETENSFVLLLWNRTEATVAVNKQPKSSRKNIPLVGGKRLAMMVQGSREQLRIFGWVFSVKSLLRLY